jgi:molybdopterin molybdotransferase
MLSVAEAQTVILKHAQPLPAETVLLSPAALGLVLAENVASDLDMPPHDKALMDGFAVRTADLLEGRGVLEVIEQVTAGQTPTRSLGPEQATRIMTGAPIPSGADAVVMVERTRQQDGHRVEIEDRPRPGQHILPQAREMHCGETVLASGAMLRPQELGLLAGVGRTAVKVHPAPEVAILPTGDELVEAPERPGPGQIRNGNGPMLAAQAARAGGIPRSLAISRDRVDSLRPLIAEGLRSPVLVLSGGVSAGVADLVPGVLRDLGVEAHFHKVQMKPGKPVFFGTRATDAAASRERAPTLVFGLPGNPVSSLVCFELFVRPAIRRLRGHADSGPRFVNARLLDDFVYKTDRPTYHPAWLESAEEGWNIRPVPWFGSGDLRGLTRANALVLFDAAHAEHHAGNIYPVLRIED